jgi:chitodextrinase
MAGVTATDKEDGDLTSSIDVEGYVETSVLGTYILTYRVKDTDNNETTQARTVEVYSQKPVFDGVSDTTVALGATFDPMAGVSASDAEDGDLTSSIVQTGSVDVNEVGNYTLVYRVTDSANQTTTAERKVSVTDGSSCANAWNSETVYIEGDQVSHNGSTWKAGWWTRGEEPGTTGEWGVWSKVSDSSCGGETPDPDVDPTLSVTGLASSYALNNGQVTLSLQLVSNETLTVDVSVRDASNKVVEQSQTEVNGQSPLTIELQGIEAGTFQLLLEGVADDGEMVSSQNSFSVTDETTTPPPGDYPDYVAGTAYQAGDRVIGADNGVYECKPWPYTAWCASASYAPGDSLYWKDAWTKLE